MTVAANPGIPWLAEDSKAYRTRFSGRLDDGKTDIMYITSDNLKYELASSDLGPLSSVAYGPGPWELQELSTQLKSIDDVMTLRGGFSPETDTRITSLRGLGGHAAGVKPFSLYFGPRTT
ncbi:hypothetical protein C8R41DRAFT_866441 [Lentinula lateritia]|uniref:Uncharacterized protein n=1 Tax=Lentinula lateritia TaxID=40482 RepID=A0ABQ8VI77_9AGAR|nr:hypothetical protein C8R41DRAFT_866441 [Lentinula lateritia]